MSFDLASMRTSSQSSFSLSCKPYPLRDCSECWASPGSWRWQNRSGRGQPPGGVGGVLNEGRRGQGGAASTSGRLDVTASRKWAASLQRFAKKRPGTCSKGHLCITKERFLNTACEGLAPVLNPKRGREPPGIPTIHSFNILLSTYSLPGLRAYLRLGVHMHFPALIVFPSFPPLPPLRPPPPPPPLLLRAAPVAYGNSQARG